MKKVFIFLFFVFVHGKIVSQIKRDTFTLKQKTEAAELIFEGHVIWDSAFWNDNNQSKIYVLKKIQIIKQFKGSFNSDTVALICSESYRSVGGVSQEIIDGPQFYLNIGTEGIFFCNPIDTRQYYGVKNGNGIYQLTPTFSGFIGIICSTPSPALLKWSSWHRAYCSDKTFFDDIEKELYVPIQEAVGKKYKQLRLNCLEKKN